MHAPRPDLAFARICGLPRGGGAVRSEVRGGFLEVVIDRPERASAVSPGMMVDLVGVVQRLCQHGGLPVVVHSTASGAFCAGGDLRSVREHLLDRHAAAAMADVMTWALDGLWMHAGVVVAAVEGAALGGGAEWLTACDQIIVGQDARIGFVHARLGVSPGWGGARRLVERVGRQRALMWLSDPQPRPASECLAQGMADRLVPAGQALDTARRLAARIASGAPSVLAAAARLAKDGAAGERETFLELWGGPNHLAALASVRAGR